jgi:hypothetical protein
MSKPLGWKGIKPNGKPRQSRRQRGFVNVTKKTAKEEAKEALKLVRRVQTKLGGNELKYYDSAVMITEDYDGTITGLNAVTQGDGNDERIGNQIELARLNFRYYAYANTGNALTRVIIFWDKFNKISTVAELLEDAGSSGVVISPYTYDRVKQYQVLFDKTLSHNVDGPNLKNFEITIDLKGKKTVFDLVGTNINKGYLKICTISNLVTTNLPSISWSARLFYKDD